MKPEQEQKLRKLAHKYVKEHGLVTANNASPKVIWELGFFECFEWLIREL